MYHNAFRKIVESKTLFEKFLRIIFSIWTFSLPVGDFDIQMSIVKTNWTFKKRRKEGNIIEHGPDFPFLFSLQWAFCVRQDTEQ